MRILSAGNVGIGTSTPFAKLSVVGDVVAARFVATTTATSSFAGGLDVRALNVTGTASSTFANGINLSGGCFAVNGTCVGGSGGSLSGGTAGMLASWTSASALTATGTPTMAALVATSSTATSTFAGAVGIGTTTPYAKLSVQATTTISGALAVAGMYGQYGMENSTSNGFQFGNRYINTVTGSVAGTFVGGFTRMVDNTSLSNTVRGLEVQAWSGTNTSGINTGIAGFGKTFGITGTTDATAGAVSQPAAIFADLDNSGAPTAGNAFRAYTNDATSASLVQFYQETSTFTGNGLLMNFGVGGAFTGNFMDLQKAGTSRMSVEHTGRLNIRPIDSDNATAIYIDTDESTASQNIFVIESDTTNNGQSADTIKARFKADGSLNISLTGTQTLNALCHTSTGMANNDEIVDCSGAPSDLAEKFGTADATVEAGDVVVTAGDAVETVKDGFQTSKAFMEKATRRYQGNILGVISTQPNQVYAQDVFEESENPRPVAIAGRVPVKVSLENGPIQTGDMLTSASIPGYAMKATRPGMVIGQALSSFGTASTTASSTGSVIVFVAPFFYDPAYAVTEAGDLVIDRGDAASVLTGSTTAALMTMNQTGTGAILDLQSAAVSRFLVGNDGSIAINSARAATSSEVLLSVKAADEQVFAITARGDVEQKGVIFVRDNTFAGTIATDGNGEAEIAFTYELGTGKPSVQLTAEGDVPVIAQVLSWTTDSEGRYTGFRMKTFTPAGAAVSAAVNYLVVGKPADYAMQGSIFVGGGSVLGSSTGGTGTGGTTGGDTSGSEGDSSASGGDAGGSSEGGTAAGEGSSTGGSTGGDTGTPPAGDGSTPAGDPGSSTGAGDGSSAGGDTAAGGGDTGGSAGDAGSGEGA